MKPGLSRPTLLLAATLAITALGSMLSGCFPLAVTTLGATTMSVIDRRTMGAQIEDQSIQSRGNQRLKEILPGDETAYATVNSFNRRVLLVGQAPDEKTRDQAAALVGTLGNVRLIHNEIRVGGPVISSARDTALTAKVKTALLQLKEFDINAVKVITENAVVYLMGLVSQDEADRAVQAASGVSGISRVVTLFDVLSEQDYKEMVGKPVEQPGGGPRR